MLVEFDKSFEKSLDKLGDKSLFPKIIKQLRFFIDGGWTSVGVSPY